MKKLVLALADLWRQLRDPYRPELHYMRGPGPKTRAVKDVGRAFDRLTTSH